RREEAALEARVFLSRLLSAEELRLDLLARVDVVENAEGAGRLSVAADEARARLDPAERAVLAAYLRLEYGVGSIAAALEHDLDAARLALVEQVIDGEVGGVRLGVPGEALAGFVEGDEAAVEIDGVDEVARVGDDLAVLAFEQRLALDLLADELGLGGDAALEQKRPEAAAERRRDAESEGDESLARRPPRRGLED